MKTFSRQILCCIIALIYLSCDKQTQNELVLQKKYSNEYDKDMASLAKSLSTSLNNSSLRKFLKEEALKKFDGDFDVLLINILDKNISTNQKSTHSTTIKELLEINLPQPQKQKTGTLKSGYSLIDELIKKFPNLQFSIPVYCENWNAEEYNPVVTFLPKDYDEETTRTLEGYNDQGDTVVLDAIKTPEMPVIVVSESERVIVNIIEPTDPVTVPQPYNLVGSQTESGIRITWSMPSDTNSLNTKGYYIYRKSADDSYFNLIHTLNFYTNRTYDDISVLAAKSYTYYIIAFNQNFESEPTNYVTITASNKPKPVLSFDALYTFNDEVELRWENDNSQYISETVIQKRTEGSAYTLLKNFTADENNYLDYAIERGKKYIYKIEHKTPLGTSNAKWDFVQVPYRSISYASPVRILALDFSDESIERWPAGSPEFYITVSSVDPLNQKVYTIQEQIDVRYPQYFSFNYLPVNIKVFDWNPSTWYDVLTFTVIEYDTPSGSTNVTAGIGFNSKKKDETGLLISGSIDYKLTFNNDGERCGSSYYNYFDPVTKWLEFPNYGFKLLIGADNL